MRKKLTGDESLIDTVVIMAEGDSGAITVLSELTRTETGILNIFHLDDMNMRGSQIWVAYKNYCDYDITKLVKCIRNRDEGMIQKVNEICKECGETAKVSIGGRR